MSDVQSTRVCAACPCHGLPTFSHLALTHHPFQSLHTSLLFTPEPSPPSHPFPSLHPPLLFTKPPPLPSHPFPSLHTFLSSHPPLHSPYPLLTFSHHLAFVCCQGLRSSRSRASTSDDRSTSCAAQLSSVPREMLQKERQVVLPGAVSRSACKRLHAEVMRCSYTAISLQSMLSNGGRRW